MLALGQVACSARDRQQPLVNLDPALAADLAAIAAQIIPADDTPGADEAGVIYFIDGALGSFMKGAAEFLAEGAAELNRSVDDIDPGLRFSQLDRDRQRKLLEKSDRTPFFGTMKFLTVAGMFALPRYGGNRNLSGWQHLGFDSRHGWQPPFGDYDRDAHDDDV